MQAQEARRQRARVAKANRSGDLLAAEPDAERKVRRMCAVAQVGEAEARSLAENIPPARIGLKGEAALGAERIQGNTTDFVGVSFLDRARAASGCVARVISREGSPIGSGFLVSDRLFLTNNHVLASEGDAAEMLLEFNYELDVEGRPRASTRFEIDAPAFFLTNVEDDLDFTLVAVGRRQSGACSLADFGFCPIFDADDKHILSEFVNIVQHPEGDFKQVVLRENQLVTRLETVLHYLADTSPGSSGSPVFNDQWEAIALHHYGEPFRQTADADGRPVSRDLNEGIRLSAIAKALRKARPGLSPGRSALLDSALSTPARGPSRAGDIALLLCSSSPHVADARTDNPVESEPTTHDPGYTGPANGRALTEARAMSNLRTRANADGSISLTIPVEITIRVGEIGANGRAPSNTPGRMQRRKRPGGSRPPDANYGDRPGYDPNFLAGFPIAFPSISDIGLGRQARLIRPDVGEDPTILKYEHFSIVMNADRRMPFVAAVNIDGAGQRGVDRATGRARPGFERFAPASESAEAGETWYNDPRIPADAQTTQALYDNQRPHVFDRGHQVRREDPNWGDDDSAERANADTFHFTNCCPQASPFNQQARFWQGIENYVLNNARSEDAKVSVFTGPVFARNDPRYRDVRVPVQFFKIAAYAEGGELRAVALLASQARFLGGLPERLGGESFDDLGAVRQYQTTVAEIEELTGLDFGPLRAADVLGGSESAGTTMRPLKDFGDIRLARPVAYNRIASRQL
ncbi:MAG: DNA/RNA non-specific endonuclease [Isosphaeraceae bacterium]